MYQLRIYTISDQQHAQKYFEDHWQKHLVSLPKYGISVHSVFMEKGSVEHPRIFALVFSDTKDIKTLNKAYMQSADFSEDMQGFDMRAMLRVEEIDLLEPSYLSMLLENQG